MKPLRPLGRYLFRYSGWVTIALVATLTYAATTAAMIALIEPIFSEVLPFSDEVDRVASELGGAAPDEGGDARVSGISVFNLRGQLDALYERLKAFFGITPESVVFFVPALFFLVYMLRMIAAFLSGYAFQHAGLGVTSDLRTDLCDHMLHQSSRFHAEHSSGELFSRMVSDIDKMQNAVSNHLLDLLQQTTTLVVLIVLLLSTNFKLAVICLVAAPAIVYPIYRFGRGMRQTSHRSQERMAELSSLLTEMVRGHRIVKAFGMEDFELTRFRRATDRHLRVNLRAQVLSSFSTPVVETMTSLGGCMLMIYAAYLIRAGQLTTPLLIQFFTNLLLLYDPIRRLNKVNLVLQGAAAAAQRVFQMLAIPNEIVDRPRAQPLETVERGLRFESVRFGYRGDGEYVLEDFSLELPAGKMIALVGPSGAGKTTVVNLLPRFFDPEAGSISIDGVDIRDLPLKNLRSLIGLVTQETILFNDTVRNNIAYGRSEVSLERVREVAAASYADEFIMAMPQGYDTVIGESGSQLSGGQRQRLAIARALLKNAPILVLDEATSQLDTESEASVQKALNNLMQGRTTLVIAHRLSTVMSADAIVVMERGRIVERGTHAELLEMGGLYKRLYDLQFRV
ncbi:MAG TPA: ABC transporter transmembrane domain-containing protein [Thermoanaerobaculia bacterium]|jgi:subfamily B ATP-binding cassette protein MsbA|nr:ABC transporter transmembrane domain-containing protein [Thermoanaerobaculia bacterium]